MATSTTIMPHCETNTEQLATVTTLRAIENAPRELRHRHHDVEPPVTQPLAHLQWQIEQQLDALYDADQSPYDVLVACPPSVVDADGETVDVSGRASELLDAVFDAADAVADRLPGEAPSWALMDQYADSLHDLAQCLRGVS